MGKMTLADLKAMRDDKKKEIDRRETDKAVTVIIGMGTCGIAAGAKATFDAMIAELNNCDVVDVVVKQTGCMGFCAVEPTVQVIASGMPATIYNRVNAEVGVRIVKEHIVGGKLVSEHVYDNPSKDILAD